MNWKDIAESWDALRHSLRDRWFEFSEDDIATVSGRKEELVELLQRRYGLNESAAEEEVEQWRKELDR